MISPASGYQIGQSSDQFTFARLGKFWLEKITPITLCNSKSTGESTLISRLWIFEHIIILKVLWGTDKGLQFEATIGIQMSDAYSFDLTSEPFKLGCGWRLAVVCIVPFVFFLATHGAYQLPPRIPRCCLPGVSSEKGPNCIDASTRVLEESVKKPHEEIRRFGGFG